MLLKPEPPGRTRRGAARGVARSKRLARGGWGPPPPPPPLLSREIPITAVARARAGSEFSPCTANDRHRRVARVRGWAIVDGGVRRRGTSSVSRAIDGAREPRNRDAGTYLE